MALERRKNERQQDFWVATTELPRSEGQVFYQKLNKLLREAGFDEYVETLCEPHYHDTMGRPGIPPGTCCWSATSRESAASEASLGGVPTV